MLKTRRELLRQVGALGGVGLVPHAPAGTTSHRANIVQALALLDDVRTRECSMSWDDIADICDATELLAAALGFTYDEETDRYRA